MRFGGEFRSGEGYSVFKVRDSNSYTLRRIILFTSECCSILDNEWLVKEGFSSGGGQNECFNWCQSYQSNTK